MQHKTCVHVFSWKSFVNNKSTHLHLESYLNEAKEKEKVFHDENEIFNWSVKKK